MATIRLEIVTPEKMVYSDDVDAILAWGVEGQLGILPHHAPLMTILQPGDLLIRKGTKEEFLTISGGFLEVRPDKAVILADACERAEEIDVARAEAAKIRAQEALKEAKTGVDAAAAEAALRRSLARIKAVEKIRRRRSGSEIR
ncbi:MAG: F0F1 ATP synthase subunit epsilon [Deltaproteobacteria bacterium RBG_16_48_10]|nr:MAG: F0F1 ATP synthase subunit epsilon [Deltaproteobacteria bacterium RBG_16_48_10]